MNKKHKEYIIHSDKQICGFFEEYRWLSNFHPCIVYHHGEKYPSAEHAYQAAKYPFSERKPFLFQPQNISAGEAKKLGNKRDIPGFESSGWDYMKYDIMLSIVFSKFAENKDLREKLIDTGDRYLEETNHWGDTYWGVYDKEGANKLGLILMKIRDFWRK